MCRVQRHSQHRVGIGVGITRSQGIGMFIGVGITLGIGVCIGIDWTIEVKSLVVLMLQ
jgi:hypothetical protein